MTSTEHADGWVASVLERYPNVQPGRLAALAHDLEQEVTPW